MVKIISYYCQVGLDFYEYLKKTNRILIEEREELRKIYNDEFRNRKTYPKFSSVLYGLQVFGKILKENNGEFIIFTNQDWHLDQWSRSRTSQRPPGRRQGPVVQVPYAEALLVDRGESDNAGRRRCDLMKKLKTHRAELVADKNGIEISSDPQFNDEKMSLIVDSNSKHTVELYIKNTGTKTVHFTSYTALRWLQILSLEDANRVTKKNPLALHPEDSYKVKVKFKACSVGVYLVPLLFEFEFDLRPSTAFQIVRFIEAQWMTTLGKELAPTAPYKPRSLPAWTPHTDFTIVDGQPPEDMTENKLKNHTSVQLPEYKLPNSMDQLIKALKQPTYYRDKRKYVLKAPLSFKNYAKKFELLLHLEEHQLEMDIKRYNIPNDNQQEATMTKDPDNKRLLILKVPGLSENRPSVLRGDKLLAYPFGETKKKYCGYVHSVEQDSVKLGFSSELLNIFVDGMKFNIEFTVSRLTLRIQHRAAEFAARYELAPVLFPAAPSSSSPQQTLPHLKLFDRKLEENPEQYRAVQHIVAGSAKPAPYLVFGPPGTGKTVTMVEAIKQINISQTKSHILACAHSNSAADLLCVKILEHVNRSKVFRIYASSYNPGDVPKELKACCNLVVGGFDHPAKEKLMEYKIIISTLLTSLRMVTRNIPQGHFTHVFVDEAGHAVETECIVPLAGLLNPNTGQVVLAGDPKQLGPILGSPFALKFGMGLSLLERLMTKFPIYQKKKDMFDNRFVTKLLQNYRSHPAILEIPNELFYDRELKPFADEILRNSYCSWEYLPQRSFPIIFHGVTGLDTRESSSPSFFNIAEVEVLMDYVRKLLQTQGKRNLSTISPRDIGIIAPYRKQVQKIREALRTVEKDFEFKTMNDLKVGSVEEFQGQERRVILVSTVRSSPEYAEIDKKFALGFVKNEKRFNVAITRAKALLIIVGNPLVLRSDTAWARFIQYCNKEGGYRGYYPEDEDDMALYLGTNEGETA